MVPIQLNLKETYENKKITSKRDRCHHFGQDDHVRVYSKYGFVRKLEESGFKVDQLGIKFFSKESFLEAGIMDRSVLYKVTKL
jgi:hypothetical protein